MSRLPRLVSCLLCCAPRGFYINIRNLNIYIPLVITWSLHPSLTPAPRSTDPEVTHARMLRHLLPHSCPLAQAVSDPLCWAQTNGPWHIAGMVSACTLDAVVARAPAMHGEGCHLVGGGAGASRWDAPAPQEFVAGRIRGAYSSGSIVRRSLPVSGASPVAPRRSRLAGRASCGGG